MLQRERNPITEIERDQVHFRFLATTREGLVILGLDGDDIKVTEQFVIARLHVCVCREGVGGWVMCVFAGNPMQMSEEACSMTRHSQ